VTDATPAWPAQPAFSSNDGFALRAAAIAGAGLILQPEVLLADALTSGAVVAVLDGFLPLLLPVHLLYLQNPYPRRRPIDLAEFLIAELG
jgi:DNA-binding transcriptional LysR family regulator